MIHCSECKHFRDDNPHLPTKPEDEGKYIANLRCAIGEKIFVDLAFSKFEERGTHL